MTKQEQINKQLTDELNSKDILVVKEALLKLRSVGSAEMIPLILRKWFSSEDEIHNDITDILHTLKDKKAIPFLVAALSSDEFDSQRDKIISVFWNAGLDPKEYLSLFVKIACEGNYMECLECLTVIENLDPPLPEEQIMESLLILKTYFVNDKNRDDQKYPLVRTIATFVSVRGELEEE